MTEIAVQLQYSVEAEVSPAFAWQFRTNVANWSDPPARFALDGPFEVGSCGTTLCRAITFALANNSGYRR